MNCKPGTRLLGVLFLPAALLAAPDSTDRDAAPLLAKIKAVRAEGQGNDAASAAWKQLVQLGPDALLPALAAMQEKEAVANNWLRAAVDAIAEKAIEGKQPLPARELEQFVKDRKRSGVARRLAYEWLCRLDEKAPARLLPTMLADPSGELRRDAVDSVIKKGDAQLKANDKPGAIESFHKAFDAARDTDQVDQLTQKLDKLGVKVDVTAHYGCILRWQIIGPFDNAAGVGFQAAYAPEKEFDPTKTYKGKNGATVKWIDHVSQDPRGFVDLNKIYPGDLKGTVAYAHVVIDSPREQKVQLRAGSKNALRIFLNGKSVFNRDEYHHTVTMLDNHIAFGTLRAGRNDILLKICQNEMKESWTKQWEFMLRICDELGGGVPFKVIAAEPGKTDRKERQ